MEVEVGIPIAVTIPLYKTWRRCFFAISLPPSSPFFCYKQISKAFINDTIWGHHFGQKALGEHQYSCLSSFHISRRSKCWFGYEFGNTRKEYHTTEKLHHQKTIITFSVKKRYNKPPPTEVLTQRLPFKKPIELIAL